MRNRVSHCFWGLAVLGLALLYQAAYSQDADSPDKEKQIKEHIKGLASSSADAINKSANALAKIGRPAIPYLAEAYEKPVSDRHRHYIIFAAYCLNDKDAAGLLARYLEDEQKKVGDYYDALMRAEARKPKDDIFGDLNPVHVRAPQLSNDVRLMAVDQLAKFRDARVAPLFLKIIRMPGPANSALKSGETAIKQRVVRMLSRFAALPEPDPQIIGCLLELLAGKDIELARWALYGLKRAGYRPDAEQAKKLLAGYDAGILEYALALMENSRDESLLKISDKHLNHSSPFIKSCARACRRAILNETPPVTPTLTAEELPIAREFFYPIREYLKDSGRKSFGVLVGNESLKSGAMSFANTIHLGDDCGWYQDGAPVYAIADGIVRVFSRSVSYTDESNRKRWAWGNLLVIEHKIAEKPVKDKPEPPPKYICSLYAHLADGIMVNEGELVRKGQKIGAIGMGFSEENGDYEAHLHFSIYDGPFYYPAGHKVPLDGLSAEITAMKEPGVYLAREISEAPAEERRIFLLFEYISERGAVKSTMEVSGLPDSRIDELIKSYRGENAVIRNYAGWIHGYAAKEQGTAGWLDPLKFLQSKVR
jgi:murein DD-endopeptidase MepM/ murein hydrolase activator NlpD